MSVRRYRIGAPIPTESVVKDIPAEEGNLPGWKLETDKEGSVSLSISMTPDTIVYGLGETLRGINKRGWLYTSNCTDDPHHWEDKHSLYAAHNFLLIVSEDSCLGLYVDTPGIVDFDIGYSRIDLLSIRLNDGAADLYLVDGFSAPRQIVREFRSLIGQSYIPPRWALGFGQSRWGYRSADDIREVVTKYEEAGIPLDMMYLDIDYMERFKDFTINRETFPDFDQFVQEMRSRGVRLVPIIDAGVKIEEGYSVYEEGVQNGYFCRKENGEYLTAAVWPGRVHFPDFLNEQARAWFGSQYRFLLDKGIEGFWNDMNEPAIFYTEDHLKEVFEGIEQYRDKNLDIQSFFDFKSLVGNVDNNPEDYKRFYHAYHGRKIRHDKVHNLYGYYMTRAAGEFFTRHCPDKRILMFSRASYIGMHRYGGIWTGDNRSWWSHILLNLQQMPGLNMCGFIYAGADMGGFGADATEDLVLRWTALAIFMPLMRNHSARGTRRQELYQFTQTAAFRNLVRLRYALLPYLYSEMMKAILQNDMLMIPLAFEYPADHRAAHVEDQLLVGGSIMIAPVYQQNAEGRYVYLPEDMTLLRFRSPEDFDREILSAGDHYVPCALHEVLVFLRKGHVLPLAQIPDDDTFRGSRDLKELPLQYLAFDADPAFYEMYRDENFERN